MMKQLLLFLFYAPLVLFAQPDITVGLRGGLNLADVVINNVTDPDGESDFNIKTGFHAGMFAYADGDQRVGLGAELLYSVKGVNAITNINLHYITLPVLLRYAFVEKLIGEIGPEVGYLVAARSRYGNMNNVYDNKLDVGLDLGLQYHLTPGLILGMRFNAGVSSVIKNPSGPAQAEKVRYQNRVLQVSIAYRLYKEKI
jgi:hypothetical protein